MARIGWLNKREGAWVVSSWTFRQLLEDVLARHPNDPELHSQLKTASTVKQLFLDGFQPDFSERLADAIRQTASAICAGEIQTGLARKPYGTAEIIAQYRIALEELLAVIGALPDFAP